jgi:hypothetical protein
VPAANTGARKDGPETKHFPTNEPTAKTRRDAPDFIRTTTLVPEVQTQHPPNSEPIIRSGLTQITPQSRRSPIPSPHTQPEHTDKARHIPIVETPKPRRDASDLIRDATVPVKTDQTWYHPTSNPTPKTRRDASDLIRNSTAPEKTDQTRHTSETLKPRRDASDFIRRR